MHHINKSVELLDKLRKGDNRAFEEIYNTYAEDLLRYGINILRKREVVEDMVHNIFADLWKKRSQLEIKNLRSYLFQAIKYQIFNHFRSNKLSQEDIGRINIIDLSINISKDLEYEELEKIISACIGKLPNRCKEIFILSRYHNKSHKEIAADLDISIQAVKNQISKAIGVIREVLTQKELIAAS
ncbi:RNA polymerase sigma factor [Poritiphilus flavus]|uniref:RNA polymerase sigma-70 factor n=1 Tax=Poritiphilus flavus TaxID=2697053 RepID=A0A6L9E7M4_9FLAO|nr:RNA polymerase sigma-70 factor [Poritiphilus flavus]NAS10736.1 RNA polymerase sigma-70 factor [Poritiphilus flavus]